MLIIGDSTIKDLEGSDEYTINYYPGITLKNYLDKYNNLQESEDIIIYSLGTNDYCNSSSLNEIIDNYEKLKRGNVSTYIIIPPCLNYDFYEQCLDTLPDDIQFLTTFISGDNINTSKESLQHLTKEIEDCLFGMW